MAGSGSGARDGARVGVSGGTGRGDVVVEVVMGFLGMGFLG